MGKIDKSCAGCDELRRQLGFAWDLVGKLSIRDPFVVPSPPLPDTAAIVKEAISGVATIVNGYRDATTPVDQQLRLSFDQQGLDDRGGVPDNIDDFVPPWENMEGTGPVRAGWVNPPTNGAYKPYVPGEGNTIPPAGGVE